MKPLEASEIIENFHKSIKDLRPNAIVQPTSDLPTVSGRIKYAHFVWGEELIRVDMMTKEIAYWLMESYGIIDSFFVEDPDPINAKYIEFLALLKKGLITDFRLLNPFGEIIPVVEFYDFIGEALVRARKDVSLEPDKDSKGNKMALGAFIYEAYYNKAQKDKNVQSLIELVNSRHTRNLLLPNEKSKDELVFI
jgi:hypothetical protein